MSYRTYSYFMIGFTLGQLTLFDARKLIFAPNIWCFGSKISPSATTVTASSPSVPNRGAHKTVAGLIFGAQNGQDCNLTLSIHLHGNFITYVVVNMLTCSHAHMLRWLHAHMLTCLHGYTLRSLQVPLASLSLIALQSRLCIHASMHPCIHASMHPCINASMHTIVYASS